MNINKEIANTIWEQMKTIDSNLCMCMGVQKLTVISRGLQFQVNGLSFKGLVQIKLNGSDLYDVSLVKNVRKQSEAAKEFGVKKFVTAQVVQETINDVYTEDLMNLLEEKVERRN